MKLIISIFPASKYPYNVSITKCIEFDENLKLQWIKDIPVNIFYPISQLKILLQEL
jgi:hypothetical protein